MKEKDNENRLLLGLFLLMLFLAFIALIYSLTHSEVIKPIEFYSVAVTLFGVMVTEFVVLWKSFSEVKYKLGLIEGKFDQYTRSTNRKKRK